MKKVLLATTAIFGAALFSQAALANNIQVTTGGHLEFTAGVFDADTTDSSDRDFQTEAQIFVRADAKADNGLEYGAHIEFENEEDTVGAGGGDMIALHKGYLWLAGSWGKVEMGDERGPSHKLAVGAPTVQGYGQIDWMKDDGASYIDYLFAGTVGVHAVDNVNATKIAYYTPNFSGFQAGIAYTPELDEGQNVVTSETTTATNFYEDWIEVAANYTYDFGNWGLKIGGSVATADAKDGSGIEDFTAWGLGAQVSLGGFTVGGGYVDNDEFNVADGADDDANGWNLGLTYETGPLAVGVSWLSADEGANIFGDTMEDYDAFGAGMTYAVAPGLVAQADLMFVNADDVTRAGAGTTDDEDGWVFMLGTRMTF
ncbi:MAG: porin [Pseudomonadota bacterium]|nr:porin [Pseudomonadota bacterium]